MAEFEGELMPEVGDCRLISLLRKLKELVETLFISVQRGLDRGLMK